MASKRGEAKVRVERTPAGPDLASSVPWYRLMVLTRRFEDEAERAFRRGKIGGYLPLATGAAYALRYQGTDRVCLCFLGDGAMNSGSFHEPVNMAAVWGQDGMCPIVYLVENNKYAICTPVERSTVVTHLPSKFGLPGIENEQVDGQDFLAVRRAAERIVARVRATGRPYAIEAITYRLVGHGAADLFQPYRHKGEGEEWKPG